jgi:hypothetical protein
LWGLASTSCGRWPSKNLTGISLPVNSDIPTDIQVHFVDEFDAHASPTGARIVAVLIAGGDHQHAEPDHIAKAVHDLILRARIRDTARQPFGDAKALLVLPQNQNARIRRQRPTVKTRHDWLAKNL